MSRLIGVPNQHEVERFLDDTLMHGDIEALAAILDTSPSNLSQQFNPDDEKKSWFYQGMRTLWAAYMHREDLGDAWLAKINSFSQAWKHRGKEKTLCDVAHLAGKLSSETADVVIAELEKRPMQKRLREAVEVRAAVDNYIASLMRMDMEDSA